MNKAANEFPNPPTRLEEDALNEFVADDQLQAKPENVKFLPSYPNFKEVEFVFYQHLEKLLQRN